MSSYPLTLNLGTFGNAAATGGTGTFHGAGLDDVAGNTYGCAAGLLSITGSPNFQQNYLVTNSADGALADQAVFIYIPANPSSTLKMFVLRDDGAGNNYGVYQQNNGQYTVRISTAYNWGSALGSGIDIGFDNMVPGTAYWMVLTATGTNPVVITAYVFPGNGGVQPILGTTTPLGSGSYTDSVFKLTGPYCGVSAFDTASYIQEIIIQSADMALAADPTTISAWTTTGATLTAHFTGGVAPVEVSWDGFATDQFGTPLPGYPTAFGSTFTLTPTVAAGTVNWFQPTFKDSTTPTPVTAQPLATGVTALRSRRKVVIIGNSIIHGTGVDDPAPQPSLFSSVPAGLLTVGPGSTQPYDDMGTVIANYLSVRAGPCFVDMLNFGEPGSTTTNWLPTGQTTPNFGGLTNGLFQGMLSITSAYGFTPTDVIIMVGTNDSTESGYASDMAAILAALTAQWPSANLYLVSDPYQLDYGNTIPLSQIDTENTALAAVHPLTYHLGSRALPNAIYYWQVANQSTAFQDLLHPNAFGSAATSLSIVSEMVDRILYPIGSGSPSAPAMLQSNTYSFVE